MKKLFILFIALTTVLSFSAIAQPTVTIGDETGTVGSNVYVPITVTGFNNNIGAFDFYIDFDDINLSFESVANTAGGITVGTSTPGGQLYLQYAGSAIPIDNGKLLDMVFTSSTVGEYDLEFFTIDYDPQAGTIPDGSSVLAEAGGGQITTTMWYDGSVEFVAAVPLKNWAIFIGLGLIIAFLVVRFRRIV